MTDIPKEEKTWAMLTHLSPLLSLIGIPFIHIIAPLVVWQVKKNEMSFASSEAKECLNFQISCTIYALVSLLLMLIVIGFFTIIAVMIFAIVYSIIAGIKANDGVAFRYPLNLRLIK